ncbi:MAG: hypothetical protein SWE60_20415 [Thermodesulfobacteriota bacterium]|nr:hypothetical protein [Thermodesulfobacteriota bacterium]
MQGVSPKSAAALPTPTGWPHLLNLTRALWVKVFVSEGRALGDDYGMSAIVGVAMPYHGDPKTPVLKILPI